MPVRRATWAAPAVAVLALSGGCGGSGGSDSSSAPRESSDAPAHLPAGWRRVANTQAGFTMGIPPGWSAHTRQDATVVRSRDRGLSLAIGADRSDTGRLEPLRAYARAAFGVLSGYRGLRVNAVAPVTDARYPTISFTGTGVFRPTHLRQAILFFAIRRPRLATYSLVFFRSARVPASRYAAQVERIIRTFRAQAPQY